MTGDDEQHRPMIEVTDLVKNYGSVPAVRGVSLGVARGEVVVLIGPSGCGKSTLLRCVHLLEEPTSGTIRVGAQEISFGGGGKPFAGRRLAAYRSRIGMVFQQFELFPHMTALSNVGEGPRTVLRLPRTEMEARAREFLAKVGLADKADALPAQLSGGQQQRVAIARALAMQPSAMLFDEATSALDPETVGEVLSVMQQLATEGMTMLVVTHEIAFARSVANWVVVMENGQVLEEGTPDRIFGAPRMARAREFLQRVEHAPTAQPAPSE